MKKLEQNITVLENNKSRRVHSDGLSYNCFSRCISVNLKQMYLKVVGNILMTLKNLSALIKHVK